MPASELDTDDSAWRLERYRALADPSRLSILEALRVRGSLTSAELGRLLPRAKGSMHHHLRVLSGAGLIEPVPAGAWSVSAQDAPLAEGRWPAVGSDQAVVLRLLDHIVTHRRIERIERWERERRAGKWPDWAQADLGRDYTIKLTRQELDALARDLDEVIAQHRERAERRREQRGPRSEELVFLTLLGFPITLGE